MLSEYELEGTRFGRGITSLRQLHKELGYLQTACFVVIAFATGMRLSEILSLRAGVARYRRNRGRRTWCGSEAACLSCREHRRDAVRSGWQARSAPGPWLYSNVWDFR